MTKTKTTTTVKMDSSPGRQQLFANNGDASLGPGQYDDRSYNFGSSAKGFTIQCGAYAKESDARQRARELTDDAKKAGLPAPTVKRLTGRDGKKLWIVSIGEFKSRADGKKALAKLKVESSPLVMRLWTPSLKK